MTLDQKAHRASEAIREARSQAEFTVRAGHPRHSALRRLRFAAAVGATVLLIVGLPALMILGPDRTATNDVSSTTPVTTAAPSTLPGPEATLNQPLEEPQLVLEADGLRLEILSGTGDGNHNIRFWDTRKGPPGYYKLELGTDRGIWVGFDLDADGRLSISGGAPINTAEIRILVGDRVAVVDELVVSEDHGEAFFVARLTDQDGEPLALIDQDGLPLSQERLAEMMVDLPADEGGIEVEVQALDENGLILETVP